MGRAPTKQHHVLDMGIHDKAQQDTTVHSDTDRQLNNGKRKRGHAGFTKKGHTWANQDTNEQSRTPMSKAGHQRTNQDPKWQNRTPM